MFFCNPFKESTKIANGPVTPSTPQKPDSEPLRAIENISTTITPTSTSTTSAISTSNSTNTTTNVVTGTEDDSTTVALATNNQSPSAGIKIDPPKAMIKPNNVLTHVIDKFVIQESNVPFPVTRQRYAEESEDTAGESLTQNP